MNQWLVAFLYAHDDHDIDSEMTVTFPENLALVLFLFMVLSIFYALFIIHSLIP